MPAPTATAGFPIKIAALRSGLSAHVIRAWEKRYQAVRPGRTGTARRLYSEDEIARLSLLKRATSAGHSIGNIARLPEEQLRVLAAEAPAPPAMPSRPTAETGLGESLERAFAAVANLDGAELERELHRSLVAYGRGAVMHHLLVPLIHRIGTEWERGEIRVAHEHVASAVIRTLLGNFVRANPESAGAPLLLATTPAGQLHELGALLAAAYAVDHGWRVTYLGPNLPAEEIAGAYLLHHADAVAVSIVYPGDDSALASQLQLLRTLLPPQAPILAGGRAAGDYRSALERAGATVCADMPEFVRALGRVRRQRAEG